MIEKITLSNNLSDYKNIEYKEYCDRVLIPDVNSVLLVYYTEEVDGEVKEILEIKFQVDNDLHKVVISRRALTNNREMSVSLQYLVAYLQRLHSMVGRITDLHIWVDHATDEGYPEAYMSITSKKFNKNFRTDYEDYFLGLESIDDITYEVEEVEGTES